MASNEEWDADAKRIGATVPVKFTGHTHQFLVRVQARAAQQMRQKAGNDGTEESQAGTGHEESNAQAQAPNHGQGV